MNETITRHGKIVYRLLRMKKKNVFNTLDDEISTNVVSEIVYLEFSLLGLTNQSCH